MSNSRFKYMASLETENDNLKKFIERLIEAGNEIVDEAQSQDPDVFELREVWQSLVAEWERRNDSQEEK